MTDANTMSSPRKQMPARFTCSGTSAPSARIPTTSRLTPSPEAGCQEGIRPGRDRRPPAGLRF